MVDLWPLVFFILIHQIYLWFASVSCTMLALSDLVFEKWPTVPEAIYVIRTLLSFCVVLILFDVVAR